MRFGSFYLQQLRTDPYSTALVTTTTTAAAAAAAAAPREFMYPLSALCSQIPELSTHTWTHTWGAYQVAIETCYQNVGVATAVALSMFEGREQAKAVGVPL